MATPEEKIPAEAGGEAGTQSQEGAGGAEGAAAAAPAAPTALPDAESMPEELRGMSIEQFKGVWDVMKQVQSAQNYARDMAPAAPPAPPPPPTDDRPFQERFEEDPEGTLDRYVEERQMPRLEAQAQTNLENTLIGMRSEVPDFKEKYERKTRETLTRLGIPAIQITPQAVRYAYLIARGELDEAEAAKPKPPPAEATATEVAQRGPETAPEPELAPHQVEIAARLFGPGPEGLAKYREWNKKGSSGYQTIDEVPLERKDYGKPTAT